jgi:hypothetical protein
MSNLREAAQQALAYMDSVGQQDMHPEEWAVAEALRAALEQPEQEPVAWQWLNTAHFRQKLPANAEPGAWNPLYTHPPRREWRGLTEIEICDIEDVELTSASSETFAFARAIEQALRERNV